MVEIFKINPDYLIARTYQYRRNYVDTIVFEHKHWSQAVSARSNYRGRRDVEKISLSIMSMDCLPEEWYEKQKALQKESLRRKNITSGR